MNRQRLLRMGISLLLVIPFALHATGVLRSGALEQAENIAYDLRLNATLPRTVDDRVVIVDIDDASLAEIGRWPWPRSRLAEMVDRLFDDYEIDTLGFDVVFAERDTDASLERLRTLAADRLEDDPDLARLLDELAPQVDSDALFAESLRNRNIIMGYFFRQQVDGTAGDGRWGALPPPIELPPEADLDALPIPKPQGYGANLPELQNAALGGGFFDNPMVSADGVFREIPLLQQHDDAVYGMLALQTVRAALGWPDVEPVIADDGGGGYRALEGMRLGNRMIPVNERSAVPVPYLGPEGSFPYVSAADVIRGDADADVLQDRIVLLGTTAPGLFDLRTTPVQNVYPGVEVHANVISGILDNRILQRPAYLLAVEFLTVVFLGLALTFVLPLLSPLWLSLATIGTGAAVIAGNFAIWSGANMIVPLASPVLLVVVLFIFHVAWGFFIETRGKRQLSRLFGQYVPPELVDEMDTSPEQITLRGESREMTVLFSDVRGFTTISEGLEPHELTRLINAFLTPMTRTIHQRRGTIDKYIGDAIMAFWGAPLTDPEHASHAVLAAHEMLLALDELQPEFERQGWPRLEIGIGINTGTMSVGNMGSEFRMAYTVMGDAVNLGARLEGLTKNYGVRLIVSETTREAVPEFDYRELDIVRVKGKDRPVSIFEPIGPVDQTPREVRRELRRYHAALAAYRNQSWDEAERELFSLANENPDCYTYRMYLDRIAVFRSEPPPEDWDGVFTHTSK